MASTSSTFGVLRKRILQVIDVCATTNSRADVTQRAVGVKRRVGGPRRAGPLQSG